MVLFGERQVRYVIEQYIEHYLGERPHKGLDYRRPVEPAESPPEEGQVVCHERLGGLLKSYYREAA
jgi:putative transposase